MVKDRQQADSLAEQGVFLGGAGGKEGGVSQTVRTRLVRVLKKL